MSTRVLEHHHMPKSLTWTCGRDVVHVEPVHRSDFAARNVPVRAIMPKA